MMNMISSVSGKRLELHLFMHSSSKIYCFYQSCRGLNWSSFLVLAFKLHPFWIHILYFTTLSLLGYLALMVSKPRTSSAKPDSFDVFFTSVSASTDSSMATIEMEVFSDIQLIIMTILMLAGGEVFISTLGLFFTTRSKFPKEDNKIEFAPNPTNSVQIELNLITTSYTQNEKPEPNTFDNIIKPSGNTHDSDLKHNSLRILSYVVLGYLVVVHTAGTSLVSIYTSVVPSARQILQKKGLRIETFSLFTIVSTFSNCGFVPTNENMIVFKKNSGLFWLLIPQVLLGNTLYPSGLRLVIWALKKITKRDEFEYLLKNYRETGYDHLLSGFHSSLLAATVFGFIFVQLVLFCSLEWNSEAMDGLSSYERFVASLFQVVNSRHTGESVFDLSIITPAILVLFVVMMYLPPYTSFLPTRRNSEEDSAGNCKGDKKNEKRSNNFLENVIFSQLSYLVIFIILICITERDKLKEDPLNFNVLSITIEVISAYGNVGLSTGYSCKRQLKAESSCKDVWCGFVGKWSNKGKFILIVVMFFGRLKKFNMNGGKAWNLS